LRLNFANIIASPLLLGVGVAFKIYYIVAWRSGKTNLLQSSPEVRRDIQRADDSDSDSLWEPLALGKSGHIEHGHDGPCAPLYHGRRGSFSTGAHGTAPQNSRFSFGRRGTGGLKSGQRSEIQDARRAVLARQDTRRATAAGLHPRKNADDLDEIAHQHGAFAETIDRLPLTRASCPVSSTNIARPSFVTLTRS
jgi:hypothetical protein